jgi:hypothetical protein
MVGVGRVPLCQRSDPHDRLADVGDPARLLIATCIRRSASPARSAFCRVAVEISSWDASLAASCTPWMMRNTGPVIERRIVTCTIDEDGEHHGRSLSVGSLPEKMWGSRVFNDGQYASNSRTM